ncbi:MAG: acyl carrier protein [Clostridia bacterium]|nr:acyl carrier protein [Clostridia bacterium]
MELEQVKKILAEQFSMSEDDITMDTSFAEDIGADSLDLVELVMALEQEFDLEIDDEEVENIKTVGDAVRYIKDKA